MLKPAKWFPSLGKSNNYGVVTGKQLCNGSDFKLSTPSINAEYHLCFLLLFQSGKHELWSMRFLWRIKSLVHSERTVANVPPLFCLLIIPLAISNCFSCSLFLFLSSVSQHSGVITNHLGTSASSPNSESDNHALLDEKEDSYFSEIRNFIANSEMNQASALADKR